MVRLYHKLRAVYFFPARHKKITIVIILLLLFATWTSPLYTQLKTHSDVFYKHTGTIKNIAKGFLFGKASDLKSTDNRTNFIVLGLGGPRNEPSSLTDTQQFFSYQQPKNAQTKGKHLLLSIPRDIWLPDLEVKINSAYSYGNSTEGTGITLTKKAITEITGQPVHYSLLVSFAGFIKLIDILGGIDVDVANSFTDPQYPIAGRENDTCGGDPEYLCRWESITFAKGKHHFDGATALKFVRSRHARGDEGTDFARAARQQKVMLATKNKILSPSIFLNPVKIEQLLKLIGEVFETDIPQTKLGIVARALLETRGKNIHTESLPAIDPTNPDENLEKDALLIHPPTSSLYKNQWVLIPIGGTWEPTQRWVACLLKEENCPVENFAPSWKNQSIL